jgi:hypothetical protein
MAVPDKYVSQCGAIVRDNVPISYRDGKEKQIIHTWFQNQ